ncbi:hypothetical protein N7492_003677 [Penicillium capsulatum]|uniref:DUF7730 domain-containing protein n=1 Tax=Penicillium capsulatum TaxID=69766 RepID=A0A9W9IMC4_9EURO|nr:hypothetical protein N7492_003677 [Penicillium capsulatum]KAJ6121742.1 hypothetical protein N7512_004207 [Penicillium capsulatum]
MTEDKGNRSQANAQVDLKGWDWFEQMTLDESPLSPDPRGGTAETAFPTPEVVPTADTTLSRLQQLPSELLLIIYEYVIGNHRVLVKCQALGNKRGRPRKNQRSYTETYLRGPDGSLEDRPSEILYMGLMLSCRRFYCDMMFQMYASTQFVFLTTTGLRRFLDRVKPEAKALIRHVELRHITFDDPREHIQIYEKDAVDDIIAAHHQSRVAWTAQCERLLEACPNLQVLYLYTKCSLPPTEFMLTDTENPASFLLGPATHHIPRVYGTVILADDDGNDHPSVDEIHLHNHMHETIGLRHLPGQIGSEPVVQIKREGAANVSRSEHMGKKRELRVISTQSGFDWEE